MLLNSAIRIKRDQRSDKPCRRFGNTCRLASRGNRALNEFRNPKRTDDGAKRLPADLWLQNFLVAECTPPNSPSSRNIQHASLSILVRSDTPFLPAGKHQVRRLPLFPRGSIGRAFFNIVRILRAREINFGQKPSATSCMPCHRENHDLQLLPLVLRPRSNELLSFDRILLL